MCTKIRYIHSIYHRRADIRQPPATQSSLPLAGRSRSRQVKGNPPNPATVFHERWLPWQPFSQKFPRRWPIPTEPSQSNQLSVSAGNVQFCWYNPQHDRLPRKWLPWQPSRMKAVARCSPPIRSSPIAPRRRSG